MYWLATDKNGPITIKIQIYLQLWMEWHGMSRQNVVIHSVFYLAFKICVCVCVWKFTIGFTTNHLNSNCVVAKWSKLLLHRKLIDLSHIFALDTNVVQLSIFGGRYASRYANIFAYYAICEYFWTPSKK